MLTIEQLREIRSAMTWGDQAYGKAKAKDDNDGLIKHAMHRAAKRLELVDEGATLDDFLDNVRMDDLNAALEDADADPTQSADTPT
jgi:hypothetical protein